MADPTESEVQHAVDVLESAGITLADAEAAVKVLEAAVPSDPPVTGLVLEDPLALGPVAINQY